MISSSGKRLYCRSLLLSTGNGRALLENLQQKPLPSMPFSPRLCCRVSLSCSTLTCQQVCAQAGPLTVAFKAKRASPSVLGFGSGSVTELDAVAQHEASTAACPGRGCNIPVWRVLVSLLHAESVRSVLALHLKCIPQQIKCFCLGKCFQTGEWNYIQLGLVTSDVPQGLVLFRIFIDDLKPPWSWRGLRAPSVSLWMTPTWAGGWLFLLLPSNKWWDNSLKLYQGRFRLEIRNNFFTKRVIKHWNRLPRDLVELPSLEVFESVLMSTWHVGTCATGGLDSSGLTVRLNDLKGIFQPDQIQDLTYFQRE